MTTKTNKSSNHCFIICCGQGLVVSHCLIICCGRGLVASYCFITFATKDFIICRGLGSVVCYCLIICCGQGLVASYCFITFATKTKFHTPKRTFRARLPPNFIEQSFQNERFLRGFLEISQNKLPKRAFRARLRQTKLPKRAFRARLPQNFTEQASKTNVLCEAS